MGNLMQASVRGHMPSAVALALLPRVPGFASLPAHATQVRVLGASYPRSGGGTQRGLTSRRKRFLGALSSEASRVGPDDHPRPPAPGSGGGDNEDYDAVARATLRWVRSTVVGLNLCPWAGGALVGGNMRIIVHPPLPPPSPRAAGNTLDGGAGSRSNSQRRCGNPDSSSGGDGKWEEGRDRGGSVDDGFATACVGRAVVHPGEEEGGGGLEGLVEVVARQAAELAELRGVSAANATTLVVARPPMAEDFEEFLDVAVAVDDFLDDSGLRGTVQLATFHPQYRFKGTEEGDASNYTNRSPYPVLHLLLEDQVSAAIAHVGDSARVWQRNVDTTRKLGVEVMRRGMEACLVETTAPGKGGGHER